MLISSDKNCSILNIISSISIFFTLLVIELVVLDLLMISSTIKDIYTKIDNDLDNPWNKW